MHRKKRNASFDSEPVFGKSLDKLSIDDFKNQFHELTGEMLDDAAIKKLGLIKEQQSVLLPTNANELKAYPEIEFKWFEKGSQLQLQFIKKNYQPEIDHLIDLETIGMELAAMLDLSWDQVRTKSEPSWHQLVNLLAFAESARPIKELMSLMVWKNRSKFRAKYVTPLIELDLLRMTIPDKPNSSKQQYHLTKKGRKILELLRY